LFQRGEKGQVPTLGWGVGNSGGASASLRLILGCGNEDQFGASPGMRQRGIHQILLGVTAREKVREPRDVESDLTGHRCRADASNGERPVRFHRGEETVRQGLDRALHLSVRQPGTTHALPPVGERLFRLPCCPAHAPQEPREPPSQLSFCLAGC
jgi:hypothetical protein